jgi:hypothetical protein
MQEYDRYFEFGNSLKWIVCSEINNNYMKIRNIFKIEWNMFKSQFENISKTKTIVFYKSDSSKYLIC